MCKSEFEHVGFREPVRRARPLTPRKIAFAELLMTVALIVSIAVAATAVSFGIARADGLQSFTAQDGSVAAATLLSIALITMGAVTVIVTWLGPRRASRSD